MADEHLTEVERVLLYLSEARGRAERSAAALEEAGAELHVVAALRDTEAGLAELHRLLLQKAYFAVGGNQLFLG